MAPVIDTGRHMNEVSGRQLDVLRIAPVDMTTDEAGQVVTQRFAVDTAPMAATAREVTVDGYDVAHIEAFDAGAGLDDLTQHFVPDDKRIVQVQAARPDVMDGKSAATRDDPRH